MLRLQSSLAVNVFHFLNDTEVVVEGNENFFRNINFGDINLIHYLIWGKLYDKSMKNYMDFVVCSFKG